MSDTPTEVEEVHCIVKGCNSPLDGDSPWLCSEHADWGQAGMVVAHATDRLNQLEDEVDERLRLMAENKCPVRGCTHPKRTGGTTCWGHIPENEETALLFGSTPSEEVRVTSPTGGQKGQKRARFDLIPPQALWKVAEQYGLGVEKYEEWNWRRGMAWSLPLAALERHLSLFKQGEDIDPENGSPHLAAVVFHALTLLTYMEEQIDYDDRWRTDGTD